MDLMATLSSSFPALAIALFTEGIQAFGSAVINPVKSLKTE